jgi:hypothetical protein
MFIIDFNQLYLKKKLLRTEIGIKEAWINVNFVLKDAIELWEK